MAVKTEGFICPECLLDLDCEASLMTHFEEIHVNQPQRSYNDPQDALIQDYKHLVSDYAKKNTDLLEANHQLSLKANLLEEVVLAIVSDTFSSADVPKLRGCDNGLQKKLEKYHKEESKRRVTSEIHAAQSEDPHDVLLDCSAANADGVSAVEVKMQTNAPPPIHVQPCPNSSSFPPDLAVHDHSALVDLQLHLQASQQECRRLSEEVNELQSKLSDARATALQCDQIKSELVNRREDLTKYKTEHQALERALAMSEATGPSIVAKVQSILAESSSEKTLSAAKVEGLAEEVHRATKQRQETEDALQSMREKYALLELEMDQMRPRMANQDALIKTLKSDVDNCVAAMEARSSECARLQDRLDALIQENTLQADRVATLTAELEEADQTCTRLRNSEAQLKAQVTSQQAELASHGGIVADLQSTLSRTRHEHQTLVDQFIDCQNKSTQSETALETCHRELESLQRIVLDLGRQNQTLQINQERVNSRLWVADNSVADCTSCQKEFSISIRKHHCRHCGRVFCQTCSSRRAPTPASKTPLRVCDTCFTELTGVR